MKKIYSLALCLFAIGVVSAPGAMRTWITGSGTNDWSEGTNWSGGVPVDGDDVVITNSGNYGVRLANVTSNLRSLTLSKTLIFTNWNSALNATNVTIQSEGVLTLPAAFSNSMMSNNIYVVCSNLTVDSGGSINVDAKGYVGGRNDDAGQGPGGGGYRSSGSGGGGGGYGGRGGGKERGYGPISPIICGLPYGSSNAPVNPGSGGAGGSGGNGGGAVRLQASGAVTVNGTILANGGNGGWYAGGGSGGGIYISCNTFAGTSGILRANGGAGAGAGHAGGGGRIAIIYDSSAQSALPVPVLEFSTTPGASAGDIGTLYFPDNRFLEETISRYNGQWIVPGLTNWSVNNLLVSNVWIRFGAEGFQLTVTADVNIVGSSGRLDLGGNQVWSNGAICSGTQGPILQVGGNLIVTNGGSLYIFAGLTNSVALEYGALVNVSGDVFVRASSQIAPYSHPTNGGVAVLRMQNLTVSSNGTVSANAGGYGGGCSESAGYGPGRGNYISYYGGGGGYGGQGGGVGGGYGDTYGTASITPAKPGSGGGGSNFGYSIGGDGGGCVRIEAANSIMLYGTISASGVDAGDRCGGGSGGGVYLACNRLQGAAYGRLTANGGTGGSGVGYGGGGGRIAVLAGIDELTGETPGTYVNYAGSANGIVQVTLGAGPSGNGTNGTFYLLLPGTVILIR